MAYNSFLNWYQSQPKPEPEPENRAVAVAETTEKRSYSLSDPNFWRYFNLGPTNLANADVNQHSALSVPPFFCAVLYISQGVAMLDRRVMRRKSDGVHEADAHDLWDFFTGPKPHPHYTWTDFLCALLTNACLGNGYARIHWDYETMRPLYLEHIPMMYVRPEYDQWGNLWYRVSGTLNGKSVSELIPHTDMIHIKGLSLDGVSGYDMTWLHQPTFATGIARQNYTTSVLGKSGFPSIAVKTDVSLDEKEVANIEENLMRRIGGASNAGRPLVLDSGQTVQYLQWSPLDVALEALSNLNVEDVSRITKVPLDFLGRENQGTYGAGVQRSKDFLLHCLSPWIEKIQEEFSCKLFHYSESRSRKYYFEFDSAMYVALDKEAESKMLADQVALTIRTPNEARKAIGLPPVEGGDELLVGVNLLPMSQAVKIAYAKYLSAEGEKAVGGDRLTSTTTDLKAQNGRENGKYANAN